MIDIDATMMRDAATSSIFNKGRVRRRKGYGLPTEYEHEVDRFVLAHARKSRGRAGQELGRWSSAYGGRI